MHTLLWLWCCVSSTLYSCFQATALYQGTPCLASAFLMPVPCQPSYPTCLHLRPAYCLWFLLPCHRFRSKSYCLHFSGVQL